jgi:hypothetical protein
MVLYTAGKMARNAAKIINLPTCGGDKKGGLAPSVGWFNGMTTMAARNATNTQFGLVCRGNNSNPSQQKARAVRMGII